MVNLNYYGRRFQLPYDMPVGQVPFNKVDQQSIAAFWSRLSETNYTPLVDRMQEARAAMHLNDFGYLKYVEKTAAKLYPGNKNAARLFTWFVMVRSGYAVRVGYSNNEVALLIPSRQQIYELSFLNVEGVRYYIYPSLSSGSFYTYAQDYAAGKSLDFNLTEPMQLAGRRTERVVKFDFEGKNYEVKMAYDPDLVEFYNDYPQLGFEVYFNAAVSQPACQSVLDALKPITDGMDEAKAANFLLRFVQTGFAYKTDPEQFGREKYFFAEEVFRYPYCDCEDRSVLYAYLVRRLKGLDVVGLEYPGHMATAVAFPTEMTGTQFDYKSRRYVLADPTYINAPVGLCMPSFKTTRPVIHPVVPLR